MLGQFGLKRWMAALSPSTRSLALMCVNATYARGLRTKATSGYRGRERLLAKHSTAIAIDRADNSLLDRIRHASVARVAMCRYSDHFWSPAASSRSVFNAGKLKLRRGKWEKNMNVKQIDGSPSYLWPRFCSTAILRYDDLNWSCDLIWYPLHHICNRDVIEG